MARGSSNHALAVDIDQEAVAKLQDRIHANSKVIDIIVDKLVHSYCKSLDEYMSFIREILADANNPPTDAELDDFTLNLPVLMYFTGEAQETLGVHEDVAKAVKMELYNEVYEKSTGTVADKTAAAELATQNEYITHIAYSRAYKKIKNRMDMAMETLQSIKKVISRRITEMEVSSTDPSKIRRDTNV